MWKGLSGEEGGSPGALSLRLSLLRHSCLAVMLRSSHFHSIKGTWSPWAPELRLQDKASSVQALRHEQ